MTGSNRRGVTCRPDAEPCAQAKGLFNGLGVPVVLVAGVHRTESITVQKGAPVMSMEERVRCRSSPPLLSASSARQRQEHSMVSPLTWPRPQTAMVLACKWVDEVVELPEYLIDRALLDSVRCEFVAHGDDIPIRTDGTGMFHEVGSRLTPTPIAAPSHRSGSGSGGGSSGSSGGSGR